MLKMLARDCNLIRLPLLVCVSAVLFSLSSCNKVDEHGVPTGSSGLKAGINYMQPNKWELSYKYLVKEISSTRLTRDRNPSTFNANSKVVGPGTYEIWMVGPMECDEIRNIELVSANPEPTRMEYSEEDGITFLYYDVAPDDRLPEQFTIDVTWNFYTFERYTHWTGMEELIKPYDKESELYKEYTKEEYPIEFHKGIVKDAKECVDPADPDNVKLTTLNIYNRIISEYTYDWKHYYYVAYGEDGLVPTSRVWINKLGVCDEFANMFVAMARINGIPARPVAGLAHIPERLSELDIPEEALEEYRKQHVLVDESVVLRPGGHSWAEFYIEGVGWIPVDATWGENDEIIMDAMSPMGHKRNIPYVDYYFGKMDPFRITMFKSWNYELLPNPRTPDAEISQPFLINAAVRYSGIDDMVHGFDITQQLLTGYEHLFPQEILSKDQWDWKNVDQKLVHIANPPKEEVEELIREIEEEGFSFVRVPQFPWVNERETMTMNVW